MTLAAGAAPQEEGGGQCKYESALERQLQHPDPQVRQRTLVTLGHVGERAHPSHAGSIAKCLEDEDLGVVACAAVALARMGAPGAAALAIEMEDGRPDILQQVAAEALGRMPNWPCVLPHMAVLAARLEDMDDRTRGATAEAVCRLSSQGPREVLAARPQIFKDLRRRLNDKEARVCAAASMALAHLDRLGGAAALGGALEEDPAPSKDDQGDSSRRAMAAAAALHGLGFCADDVVVPWTEAIVLRLQDPSALVQATAQQTLSRLGPSSAAAIAGKLVQVESPAKRELFVNALGYIGAPQALPHVPVLLRHLDLASEKAWNVQTAAAMAIGRIGAEAGIAAAEGLASFLIQAEEGSDHGQQQRAAATQGLRGLGEVAAPALGLVLQCSSVDACSAGLHICFSLGPQAAAAKEFVVKCVENSDENVRLQALKALGALGAEAADEGLLRILTTRLEDASPAVVRLSISALGDIGAPALGAATEVAKHLISDDEQLRLAAVFALCQFGPGLPAKVVKAVAKKLKDEQSPTVREHAARTLGAQGEAASQFTQAFVVGLKDTEPSVRAASAVAIGSLANVAANMLPAFCNMVLSETEDWVRAQALSVMDNFGQSGVFNLASRLEDHNSDTRQLVLEALATLSKLPAAQELCPTVMRLLKDEKPAVRSAAVAAVAELAATQLEQDLMKPDSVRAEEAYDYQQQYKLSPEAQAKKAAEALAGLLDGDFKVQVRLAAARGLKRLGTAMVTPFVEIVADQCSSSSPALRREALLCLGGLEEAALPHVDKICAQLGGEGSAEVEADVQRAAAAALGMLGHHLQGSEVPALLARRVMNKLSSKVAGVGEEPPAAVPPAVACLLSPGQPSVMKPREGPRRSFQDAEAWQLTFFTGSAVAESTEPEADDASRALDAEAVARERRQEAERLLAEDHETRQRFADNLPLMGPTGAALLRDCLEHPDADTQLIALDALSKVPQAFSKEVGRAVVVHLDSGHRAVRQAAVDNVNTVGEAGLVEKVLAPSLEDEEAFIRHQTVVALGILEAGAAPQSPAVALRLCDACWSVRLQAVASLRLMGEAGAAVLAMRLEDEEPQVRLTVTEALGHLGPVASPHIRVLVRRLGDTHEPVHGKATEALMKVGAASPPSIAEFIQSGAGTREVQIRGLQALGQFGEAAVEFAPVLAGFVGCGVEELEKATMRSLERMGGSGAAAVAAVLAAPAPPVHVPEDAGAQEVEAAQLERRGAAAIILGQLGEANAVAQTPLLASCLAEPDVGLKNKAAAALLELGKSGAAALSGLLLPEAGYEASSKVLALVSLGKMGSANAGPHAGVIAACMEDPRYEVRRAAAEALGCLGTHVEMDHMQKLAAHVQDSRQPGATEGGECDAMVRRSCAEALGKLGPRAQPFVEDLARVLEGQDSWCWPSCAEALRRIGSASADHATLLATKLGDDTASVRWSAMQALEKLGPVAVKQMTVIVKHSSAEDASMRRAACQTMAIMGEAAVGAAAKLAVCLKDRDPGVRENAAIALGAFGPNGQEAVLAGALEDPNPSVRKAACDAMKDMQASGTPYIGLVAKLLNEKKASVRRAAARCVLSFGANGAKTLVSRLTVNPEDVFDDINREPLERNILEVLQEASPKDIEPHSELLALFLGSNKPELREGARKCLSKVGQAGQLNLIRRVNDLNASVRQGVAEALGFLLQGSSATKTPSATSLKVVAAIAEQLHDTADEVRQKACQAIGRIGGQAVENHVADLARRLEEHDVRVYHSALEALGKLGHMSSPYARHIALRLEGSEPHVRAAAARALGNVGSNAGLPYAPNLALCIQEDPDPEVRCRAAEALGLLGADNQQATAAIAAAHTPDLTTQLLEDTSAKVRKTCADVLGKLGMWASPALGPLTLALDDSEPEVRRAAARAMACLGQAVAPKVLAVVRALEDNAEDE